MSNISPAKLKINSASEIEKATGKLLEVTRGRKRYIVGPGCELTKETPLENFLVFMKPIKK